VKVALLTGGNGAHYAADVGNVQVEFRKLVGSLDPADGLLAETSL